MSLDKQKHTNWKLQWAHKILISCIVGTFSPAVHWYIVWCMQRKQRAVKSINITSCWSSFNEDWIPWQRASFLLHSRYVHAHKTFTTWLARVQTNEMKHPTLVKNSCLDSCACTGCCFPRNCPRKDDLVGWSFHGNKTLNLILVLNNWFNFK